ncbi:hypothetical protein DSO57_1009631 [Entomophthora muscae]|uniref:Uncharacterized protein n=1 Tax=Entomophthora muscae TaxID=34485 RepID=A0ACC2U593_9FUNG|nr:hypothetical protein DSO57_1009631 [Entomophthora muscae]
MASSGDASPRVKEEGCWTGREGEPQIKYVTLIAHLNQDIDKIIHNYKAFDLDLQEISKLTKSMDECFFPLIVQVQELSSHIFRVCVTAATTSLTTLKEILHQLWALQPPAESKTEFIFKIHVLNSNSQDSSSESANTGVNPNYKPSFKQLFDPKTSTIATFLTIYETAMS